MITRRKRGRERKGKELRPKEINSFLLLYSRQIRRSFWPSWKGFCYSFFKPFLQRWFFSRCVCSCTFSWPVFMKDIKVASSSLFRRSVPERKGKRQDYCLTACTEPRNFPYPELSHGGNSNSPKLFQTWNHRSVYDRYLFLILFLVLDADPDILFGFVFCLILIEKVHSLAGLIENRERRYKL